MGNRETEQVQAKTATGTAITLTTYKNDEQNRLVAATEEKGDGTKKTTTYVYDNNGNLTRKSLEQTREIDPSNPPKAKFGMYIEGQKDGATKNAKPIVAGTASYEYAVWNQLVKATTGEGTSTYRYNGEGYRTEKTENGKTTRSLYEGDKVILETDENGKETARNIYGTNLIARTVTTRESGTTKEETYSYMYNGHGDVTALLGTDGTVAASYYYDAFGNQLETHYYNAAGTEISKAVDNPYRYAGYVYDSTTDLYYLNARMYDAKTARFLQEDTYLGNAADPLSLNLYTYCHNEPVMYSDPTGHMDAYLTDLAQAANGTAKWDSVNKVAVVKVNGVEKELKVGDYKNVNGKIVIDNEKFDSLFTKTSGNSLITVDTTVKNGKITATQTVKSGTYTVAQTSLAGQTNNYYKDTHNPTSGNNANKANSTINKGTGNPVTTSVQSFKEIGADFVNGAVTRKNNALNSPYDFVNYSSFGISGGIYSGAMDRVDKMFDSPYDFTNWATFGIVGTVKGAFLPEEPFSKEHWLNSIGFAATVVGGAKFIESSSAERVALVEGASNSLGKGPFKVGEMFETSFKTKSGIDIGGLADVEINGTTLTLKDVSIYSNQGNIPNAVGARDIFQWQKQVSQMAKEQGFTTLKIQGVRVPGSTSANPGKVVDYTIDLTKLK